MPNIYLLPIGQTSCKWWRHKTFKKGIKIIPTNKKDIKTAKALTKLLQFEVKKNEECIRHKLDYALFNISYRLYRRGKNRCLYCGIKLNAYVQRYHYKNGNKKYIALSR